MSDDIFTEKLELNYTEVAPEINFEEFEKVITSRRSVRVFGDEEVPDEVVQKAIEHGLLAPNSSNLQPWEFHWVKSDDTRSRLAKFCFGQNGAKTAKHLIVCVAKTDTWRKNSKRMISSLEEVNKKKGLEVPKAVKAYYSKVTPMAYGYMGPFGILSPFKWLFFNTIGLFQVIFREPMFPSELKTWAHKTTALACENIMLSVRAQGYDTLPMEGFDAKRAKKLLGLGCHDHITMILGVGKRSENGVYGPQFRFPKEEFIKKH
ncbi:MULTISPECIES: nitroreductase family protein [Halobacteriovorax]|uniref:Nitroreductase family protein n=1 Tax=Halobacteriovorax vibrionivorans TaxID=2152716 RepID=A0ABY0IE43_9BACT|nr:MULTISPECIES: nitroreductase family protein [Halobacteriovorax]AYF44245.1 nitroreductase family protein [Halobacteriovorax sp. BALOs_7]RZF21227.1 nitroreductase family protein [Halobacteriovorax vibrionivorans]TGD48015.1 nitroreductase family protein [Halobacteriovorax sp. Y22]